MTADAARAEAGLHAAVAEASREARRDGRSRWVALRGALEAGDGLARFDSAEGRDGFYWERPSDAHWIAGIGAAAAIECRGPERFAEASRRAGQLFGDLHCAGDGASPDAAGPLLVGGFAFAADGGWSGFPPARLVLPELLMVRLGDRTVCTVSREVAPHDDTEAVCAELRERLAAARRAARGGASPRALASTIAESAPHYTATADRSHAEYAARVEAALEDIAAGELEKVVIARSVSLGHAGGFEPRALLDALRRTYPSCASFAVSRPGAGVFLGATPERLVRLSGRRVETAAVAGSAARGRSPSEDAALGRALRESKKEQAEHAVVVRALHAALAEHCHDVSCPEAPRLLALEGIQHLETPISGTLARGGSVLDLVARLHPTPAVAGTPRDAALAWLGRNEDLRRGWYAGAVGFVDRRGSGEFCVALRSALLRDDEARLFAGAGIVAGSEPEAELRETRLKLRALLAPLLEI